jgi:hypothetical protein
MSAGPVNSCPHCRAEPCVPLWRKLFMGTIATASCRECGFRVGLDVKRGFLTTMLVVVPPLVLVFVSIFESMFNVVNITSLVICGLFYFGCLVLSLVLQLFWVRLRRDEYTTESMVEAAKERIAEKRK